MCTTGLWDGGGRGVVPGHVAQLVVERERGLLLTSWLPGRQRDLESSFSFLHWLLEKEDLAWPLLGAGSMVPLPTCGPVPSYTNKQRWFTVVFNDGTLKLLTARDFKGVNRHDY